MATAAALEPEAVKPPVEDDYEHYEEIDGVRVELPPMSAYATRIASGLHIKMGMAASASNQGEVVAETLFRLSAGRTRSRRPDIAFVSRRRWPDGQSMRWRDNAWEVVPDLVVEVVSPTDRAEEIMEKLGEYFRAGVQLAWVVYPRTRLVHVFRSLNDVRPLGDQDVLEGQNIITGFTVRVGELFPPLELLPEDMEGDE